MEQLLMKPSDDLIPEDIKEAIMKENEEFLEAKEKFIKRKDTLQLRITYNTKSCILHQCTVSYSYGCGQCT